jgi:hypothetical protein
MTRATAASIQAQLVLVVVIVAVIAWMVTAPPKPTAIGNRPGLSCMKNSTSQLEVKCDSRRLPRTWGNLR